MKDSTALVSFGKRLRSLRESNNISVSEFCQIMNIDQKTLDQYENGTLEPKLMTIMLMAKALHVDHRQLMNFDVQ